MAVLLVSMNGGLFTLPRSGFVQQVAQTDKKQLAVFTPFNILANNFSRA
jgi:hypothetical protein